MLCGLWSCRSSTERKFVLNGPGYVVNGSDDPEAVACDKRDDPEHGPECVYKVAMKTNDGVRFMRIVGFDPAALD